MHAPQRLARHEALKSLMAERELPNREIALASHAALAQAREMLRRVVFRTVDDVQIFATADLQRGLQEALGTAKNDLASFSHHAFSAIGGRLLTPSDRSGAGHFVRKIDELPACLGD